MGRSGHRVFIDADCRGEVAGNEIVLLAPRRHDGAQPWQFRQGHHVRLAVEHGLLRLQHHEQLIRSQYLDSLHTQCTLDVRDHVHRRRSDRREVQPQACALPRHAQRAGLASEVQSLDGLFIDLKQHIGASQRRVTAQWHLGGRCKPADVPALPLAHDKRRFGEVVFGGNLLHQLIGEPCIEPIDHRRIAAEWLIAERVDLMKLQLHNLLPLSDR
ncbi:hypothetical protein D3C87_1251190 [compost metagenome]